MVKWLDARYASQDEIDAYNNQPHVRAYNEALRRDHEDTLEVFEQFRRERFAAARDPGDEHRDPR